MLYKYIMQQSSLNDGDNVGSADGRASLISQTLQRRKKWLKK